MGKETFYFSHDYGARNDPKLMDVLMDLGCEGIGAYWCIVEQLYEQGGTIFLSSCKSIAFQLHVNLKTVERLITEFNLFENDGKLFWSPAVNKRLQLRSEISEKRRSAIQKRWKNSNSNTNVSDINTSVSNSDTSVLQKLENDVFCNTIKEKEKKSKVNTSTDVDVEEKEKEKENAPSGAPSPSSSPDIKDFGECRLYSLDELLFRMQSDSGWIRAVSENLNLKEKPGGAAGAIHDFIEELRVKGVRSKRESDAKQHFVNWYRIQKQLKNDDATNSYTPARRVYQGTGKPGQSFNDGAKPKRYGEDTYRPNPNRKT